MWVLVIAALFLLVALVTVIVIRRREQTAVRETMHAIGSSLAIMKMSTEVVLLERDQLPPEVIQLLVSHLEEVDRVAKRLSDLSRYLDTVKKKL